MAGHGSEKNVTMLARSVACQGTALRFAQRGMTSPFPPHPYNFFTLWRSYAGPLTSLPWIVPPPFTIFSFPMPAAVLAPPAPEDGFSDLLRKYGGMGIELVAAKDEDYGDGQVQQDLHDDMAEDFEGERCEVREYAGNEEKDKPDETEEEESLLLLLQS